MNVLERLDEAEREAAVAADSSLTISAHPLIYYCRSREEQALITLSRNHLRALIDVARTAHCYQSGESSLAEIREKLAPLLGKEGGER